jgi:cobalt-zinc-cadmium efflux system membrane fusion protein
MAGVVQQILVSPGQSVARGQPVAILVSPDAVRISAETARTAARAGVASASAHRDAVLAAEGIIAPARAEEAQAMAREARVSASEQARLMVIGSASANGSVILRAPIGGRVAAINVQPGASLDGMTAPMLIEDSSSMQLDLQLPERLVGQVQIGQRVTLPSAGTGSSRISGRVVGVGATLDPMTRSVSVRVALSDAQTLVPGQSVQAIIEGGAAPSPGVSVPTGALTSAGNQDAVFMFDGRRMVLRPVHVVARTADRTFISAGLRPGTQVATSGITELRAASGE